MIKDATTRAKSTDRDKLTANQRFRYSDFVAVISSLSEGLGKMALGIVKIYLGSPFSAYRRCSRSVCRGQLSWTLTTRPGSDFNPPPGHVIASLDNTLYGDHLCLVAANKQKIYVGRSQLESLEYSQLLRGCGFFREKYVNWSLADIVLF